MAHILFIEDDTLLRHTLRLSLELWGHQAAEASDGKAGLAAHRLTPFDLVITDLIMPGMEGIETIIELRRRSPALKIIAISGGGMGKAGDYLSLARKFGANRVLAKPFSMDQLSAAIEEMV